MCDYVPDFDVKSCYKRITADVSAVDSSIHTLEALSNQDRCC